MQQKRGIKRTTSRIRNTTWFTTCISRQQCLTPTTWICCSLPTRYTLSIKAITRPNTAGKNYRRSTWSCPRRAVSKKASKTREDDPLAYLVCDANHIHPLFLLMTCPSLQPHSISSAHRVLSLPPLPVVPLLFFAL